MAKERQNEAKGLVSELDKVVSDLKEIEKNIPKTKPTTLGQVVVQTERKKLQDDTKRD